MTPNSSCTVLDRLQTVVVCSSEPSDDHNGNKRKRFTDEQLSALTDLAEEASWSLLSVPKEVREQFCQKYEISKVGRFLCPSNSHM